jgi:hypothetical protein
MDDFFEHLYEHYPILSKEEVVLNSLSRALERDGSLILIVAGTEDKLNEIFSLLGYFDLYIQKISKPFPRLVLSNNSRIKGFKCDKPSGRLLVCGDDADYIYLVEPEKIGAKNIQERILPIKYTIEGCRMYLTPGRERFAK